MNDPELILAAKVIGDSVCCILIGVCIMSSVRRQCDSRNEDSYESQVSINSIAYIVP